MKTIIKSILLITGLAIAAPCTYAQVSVGIGISARIAPPAIPVYVQPECPVDGYLWTPGYWAWDNNDNDYYWVPGVWVAPPDPGYLWTPPYWAYAGGYYGFHAGYWGLSVGYYGGINYGFGYGGIGFYGGMWSGGRFRYNTAAWRVNSRVVRNTYVNNNYSRNNNRYSFNGPGGSNARPTRQDALAARGHHIQATHNQVAVQNSARGNRNQRASVNKGRPSVASMNRANGSRLGAQGHAAPAATHATNRGGATRNAAATSNRAAAPQRNAQAQRSQQNTAVRHQAQQQRMQARPQQRQQQARPQRQQQARPQQQRQQARPMGGGGRPAGGGGRPAGGGGHAGGGGGGHRR